MIAEGSLDFISSNVEAQRALMHLHPCKLMKLEQQPKASSTSAAEPALQNSLAAPSAEASQLDAGTSLSQQKPSGKPGHQMLRQPAVDPSTYQDITREQVPS